MDIHPLDLQFQNTPGLIASYLLDGGKELALVETGPGSTLPALRAAIRGRGFDENDIRHVFVTHIHLDHAGAAGWWAGRGAKVYCHPNAARHLVDPSKLVESARRIYAERMDALWGEMLPAPAGNVKVLSDGESVRLGDAEIRAWDTPGHARHHHAFVLGDACFTGDVAGLRLADSPYLSVTAAPPQFDPAAYEASVDRLVQAGFDRLYLTHFGEVLDPAGHLEAYRHRVRDVFETVRRWVREGLDADEIRRRYVGREREVAFGAGVPKRLWEDVEKANAASMCADGLRLCVEKLSTS